MADHWIIGGDEVDRAGLLEAIARACDRALISPDEDTIIFCLNIKRGVEKDFPELADAITGLATQVERKPPDPEKLREAIVAVQRASGAI